ncbi:SDR family oxidoreductase [Microtetraspora sp. NBRC 13810]|uniref:SDR family NAD(P)-dependent oxidoreductase n=1 Tax=Microtetraspora sp. NBRC 13810 TaxID=3030990 RepID=UPI0025537893|nr:SDR family oxidoreductase [Microtetraspora sp. NBRC 13810]
MSGQRVLITGASRGIGAAIAEELAGRGDTIAVHYRTDRTAAEAFAARLPGEGHVALHADLSRPEDLPGLVTGAVSALGGVDVLVNNAAMYVAHPIATTSYEEWRATWRQTIEVNLFAAADVTWQVVRHLLDRPEGPGGGRIVMIGSRGAYRGEPDTTAYGASKAGLHAFAQSLAVSLAPHGIAVAAVAPGFVRTDMAEELLAGPDGPAIRAQSPFGRVAEPREIAAAVAWLTSADALWASGTVLDLNGASYLR